MTTPHPRRAVRGADAGAIPAAAADMELVGFSARLDAMRARYGDAALADGWRALCEDAAAVFGLPCLLMQRAAAYRWFGPHVAGMIGAGALVLTDYCGDPPRQPWAPRRRTRRACRR